MAFYFEKGLSMKTVSDCYRSSFNRELDKNYWNWRFLNNPISDKVYISYQKEKRALISYYAVTPCTIEINGRRSKFALSNMTMTHPDYQGRGLFKKLATELYEVLKQDGFSGVYGFANSSSHYGFRKYLNWVDLVTLNIFKVNRSSFRIFLLKNRTYTFETAGLNNDSIVLSESMSYSTGSVFMLRDTLRWKFSNPLYNYYVLKIKEGFEIVGLIFYKIFRDGIDIMEFFYVSGRSSTDILGAGIGYLVTVCGESINMWSNLYSEEHLYLEKLGFVESSFNSYFGIVPFMQIQELLNIKNWHYRFIDSDIF